eukprot:CAMPEP_0172457970 /NCGR_PEP_ID=MMETSP1065-20121228/25291_1 /TAXON_ID=265537 /ORGANISM="Amphiprora paludosa, Strain CCMP125" /LENGTH=92 /DNA_ID=CAMNT_0013211999 /DNA_START=30 /DNA_END=308 /DNA_ORIENTATION=+
MAAKTPPAPPPPCLARGFDLAGAFRLAGVDHDDLAAEDPPDLAAPFFLAGGLNVALPALRRASNISSVSNQPRLASSSTCISSSISSFRPMA